MNVQDPEKIVLTAAVNGPFTMRTKVPGIPFEGNPTVPYTPAEVAAENKACFELGVAIAHTHTRNVETGANVHDADLFADAHRRIHAETTMLCNPTTGGGGMISHEERIGIIPALAKMGNGAAPELAELSGGSFNLDMYDPETKKFAFGSLVFNNSNEAFEMFLDVCLQHNVKPVLACFEYSHLDNVVRMYRKGLIKAPVFLDFAFCGGNVTGALTPTLENLRGFIERIPDDMPHIWEVLSIGVNEFPMALWAASLGGNVRLGLEEYHYADCGNPTTSQLFEKFIPLVEALGRKPATTNETREYLKL